MRLDIIQCVQYVRYGTRAAGPGRLKNQLKISVAVAYCTVSLVLYHGMPCPPLQILFSMTMDKLSCADYPIETHRDQQVIAL